MVLNVAFGVIVGLLGLKAIRAAFNSGAVARIVGRDGTYQAGGRPAAVNMPIDNSNPPAGAVPEVQGNEAPQVGYDAGFDNPSGYDTFN